MRLDKSGWIISDVTADLRDRRGLAWRSRPQSAVNGASR